MNYTVRVEHRDNAEHKVASQFPRQIWVRQENLETALEHETCLRLAGMHSSSEHDWFFLTVVFEILIHFWSEIIE